jgi:hypothetical protein
MNAAQQGTPADVTKCAYANWVTSAEFGRSADVTGGLADETHRPRRKSEG